MKGADSVAMPEGSTLYDLVQTGLTHTHAAVGVVVRLRKELSLVEDIPVLIAIDQVRQLFYIHLLHIFFRRGLFLVRTVHLRTGPLVRIFRH